MQIILLALLVKQRQPCLTRLLDNTVSQDKITRFLSSSDFNSIQLWSLVKPTIRSIESENGVLIIDDTIQEKPHTKENEIVSWHFDHLTNETFVRVPDFQSGT